MQDLTKGRYVARLARFEAAAPLRGRVFRGGACDRDSFDARSVHVVVEDAGEVVCCYRLLPVASGEVENSYAAQFYDLGGFANGSARMVEMGRFCLSPDLHDPDILRIAWAMLARYVAAQRAEMIFGCSSFDGVTPVPYAEVFSLLKARHMGPALAAPGTKAAETIALQTAPFNHKQALRAMPPLLRSYLSMGGWVSDHAVVDRDLETLHVFTALEVAAIPPGRKRVLEALAQ